MSCQKGSRPTRTRGGQVLGENARGGRCSATPIAPHHSEMGRPGNSSIDAHAVISCRTVAGCRYGSLTLSAGGQTPAIPTVARTSWTTDRLPPLGQDPRPPHIPGCSAQKREPSRRARASRQGRPLKSNNVPARDDIGPVRLARTSRFFGRSDRPETAPLVDRSGQSHPLRGVGTSAGSQVRRSPQGGCAHRGSPACRRR